MKATKAWGFVSRGKIYPFARIRKSEITPNPVRILTEADYHKLLAKTRRKTCRGCITRTNARLCRRCARFYLDHHMTLSRKKGRT